MKLLHSSRRHRLIRRVVVSSIGILLLGAILVMVARSRTDSYHAGDQVEGITRTLGRTIPDDLPQVYFEDVTREAGIDFVHFWKERSTQLPEDMGSGAAWGDYDSDGDLDLFLCNIAGPLTLSAEELAASPAGNRLYRNRGDGHFEDVTDAAGLTFQGVSMGSAWADYDGDGDLDLVVTNYGSNLLYENLGDERFRDVSREAGLAGRQGFWAGAAWGDYDRDGDLDLYICGYVDYHFDPADRTQHTTQYEAVVPFTLNPSSYEPSINLLYRNDHGTFTEVARSAGVDNPTGRSLSASWCDLDGDGWLDLYVANDISDNALFRNRGDGTFEEVAAKAWVADYRGAMGLALGDWDNDGDIDIFITHWIAQENALYDNTRRFLGGPEEAEVVLHFFDIADQVGLGQVALPNIGWGTSFLDYDNDGRQDIWVVNGSTFQEESHPKDLVPMKSQLFWNKGPEEGFFEVGSALGEIFTQPRVGRGAAFGDYDNDGDVDALVMIYGSSPLLLRNEGGNRNHWLKVRVAGGGHNTFGYGARVEIETAAGRQTQVIASQASYLSQNAQEAVFGLGSAERVDRVVVHFTSGAAKELKDVPTNQTIVVAEAKP